jgi:hypothetical protein
MMDMAQYISTYENDPHSYDATCTSSLCLRPSDGQQTTKKFSPQMGIDPKLLAFKASLLTAFKASGIGPVPLAFKASVMSAAPVVLQCTSEDSQV